MVNEEKETNQTRLRDLGRVEAMDDFPSDLGTSSRPGFRGSKPYPDNSKNKKEKRRTKKKNIRKKRQRKYKKKRKKQSENMSCLLKITRLESLEIGKGMYEALSYRPEASILNTILEPSFARVCFLHDENTCNVQMCKYMQARCFPCLSR